MLSKSTKSGLNVVLGKNRSYEQMSCECTECIIMLPFSEISEGEHT